MSRNNYFHVSVCRLDYQSRPYVRGVSSFRHLVAKLPPRAHSIYFRDEIGNISTSHLWSDSKKVLLLFISFINV
jgi:oligosaccharyltransferase complex subunit alpha (ribophorin I)